MKKLIKLLQPATAATVARAVASAAALVFVLGAAQATAARGATFSEPHTLFYGKVLGIGSGQPFQITEGTLAWTIRRSDGQLVTLRSALFADERGGYSYRLRVPHSAVAIGLLDGGSSAVPMAALPQVNSHQSIEVDGQPASLLGPASAAFTSRQLLRASTYRMDLALERAATDSDGDGLPDWWEDAHGFDKQDPNDASRLGTAGISASDAYARGLDPNADHSIPTLLTREIVVYPEGSTALLLDAFDADSDEDELVYRVTRLPDAGTLILRNAVANPAAPDVGLAVDDAFTQADVLSGRVVFQADGSGAAPNVIGLALHDGDAEHESVPETLRLLVYQPPEGVGVQTLPPEERVRFANLQYAKQGLIVADASTLPEGIVVATPSSGLEGSELAAHTASYGAEAGYALVGQGAAVLIGGAADDVVEIYGGTAQVAGGAGADRFVLRTLEAGNILISDFDPVEGDVLDLSQLPLPAGVEANDLLAVVPVAGGQELRIDLDGAGAGTAVLAVTLPWAPSSSVALYDLAESGGLALGSLQLRPLVSVVASVPDAERNGPTPGEYTITRRGSLAGDLVLSANLVGTAVNGSDYHYLELPLTLAAGQRTLKLAVTPYDSAATSERSAKLALLAGVGYSRDTAQSATVTIAPLKPEIALSVFNPVAVREDAVIGIIEVTRSRISGNSLQIYLNVSGTALYNTDYQLVADQPLANLGQGNLRLTLPANTEGATLDVVPLPGASLPATKTIELILNQNEDYYVVSAGVFAQVALIERYDTYEGWLNRSFAGGGAPQPLAAEPPVDGGMDLFKRYAFGLDPHSPTADGLPRPFFDKDGFLVVTYRRPLAVSDVNYGAVSMSDLNDPIGSALGLEQIPAPDGSRDPERVYFRVTSKPDSAFVDVRATKQP